MSEAAPTSPRWYAVGRAVLALGIAAALGAAATSAILNRTGGEPAVPLDDAFIHFQYARSFLEGAPFRYTPGALSLLVAFAVLGLSAVIRWSMNGS